MARRVESKENLLRDARALTPRVLLRISLDSGDVELLAGFRGSSLSLYFGEDPVYHFNAAGELRRAFITGRLVKADQGQLAFLDRCQTDEQTTLQLAARGGAMQAAAIAELEHRLRQCAAAIAETRYQLLGQFPESSDAVARLTDWLDNVHSLAVASSAGI